MNTAARNADTLGISQDPIQFQLMASRDKHTGKGLFPRIPDRSPSADRYQSITLSLEAELYSFTIIHPNPKTSLAPFALVYADFPEDVRVFGRLNLASGWEPSIGMRLRAITTAASPDGQTSEDYRFVPAEEGQA
jgi:uncharacterized OB-fold protein